MLLLLKRIDGLFGAMPISADPGVAATATHREAVRRSARVTVLAFWAWQTQGDGSTFGRTF
jgi:hypothetical protein